MKNLFEQDFKDSHINLAYFDSSHYPAIMDLKSPGKKNSSKILSNIVTKLAFWQTLKLSVFNGQLASGWETKELKGIKVGHGDNRITQGSLVTTEMMKGESTPLAKNLLIPFNQEESP